MCMLTEGCVTTNPAWLLSDAYCYIFPRPMKFHCYPGEVIYIPTHPQTGKKN